MKKYTREHEWIEAVGDGQYRVGITDFAQEQLGDVVSVELPETGQALEVGSECGVIESVKAASDIYAPVAGEVTLTNDELADNPGLINESPETDGWLWQMQADDAAVAELMSEDDYRAFVEEEQ